MDYSVRTVSLKRIETADDTFKITTHADISALAQSIGAVGLLQPPLLLPKGDGYTVVYGFRRIDACKSLPHADIAARVGDPQAPLIDYARHAIADNALQRPLNVVEQSRALALIRRFAEGAHDRKEIAASAGLPGSQAAMERLLPVADMPESLQTAIVDGSIALPIALRINRLTLDDASAVTDLFRRLNTGLNYQRELMELIGELAAINEISIAGLIRQKHITVMLANEKLSPPQHVQQLRQFLRGRRYPELSKAETVFQDTVKSLHLSPCIQLQPPRFFEGKTYRLTLSINSRHHLRSLLPEIEKIADHSLILPE